MRTHSLITAHQQPLQSNSPRATLAHVSPPPSHTCLSVPPSPPKLSYNYRPKSQARSSRSKLGDCDVSEVEEARKLRSELLQVLRSRRSGEVAMLVEPAKPVANPLSQEANPPSFGEVLKILYLAGLEVPKSKACKAYADARAVGNFKLVAQPGIRHRMTPLMVTEARDWFDQFSEAVRPWLQSCRSSLLTNLLTQCSCVTQIQSVLGLSSILSDNISSRLK